MEFAEKGDLYRYLKEAKEKGQHLKEDLIWLIAFQICLGVGYLHSQKTVHRDLKCMNIFLTKEDVVKIGDFGVAKLLNLQESFVPAQARRKGAPPEVKTITQAKVGRVGTPLYLSPEIIKQTPYDYKVDSWAVGCCIYHLAALETPFQSDNLNLLAAKILTETPKPLDSTVYSEKLNIFVNEILLQKEPTQRPYINQIMRSATQYFSESVMMKYREIILPAIKPKYSGQDFDYIYQVLIEGNQYKSTHNFFKRHSRDSPTPYENHSFGQSASQQNFFQGQSEEVIEEPTIQANARFLQLFPNSQPKRINLQTISDNQKMRPKSRQLRCGEAQKQLNYESEVMKHPSLFKIDGFTDHRESRDQFKYGDDELSVERKDVLMEQIPQSITPKNTASVRRGFKEPIVLSSHQQIFKALQEMGQDNQTGFKISDNAVKVIPLSSIQTASQQYHDQIASLAKIRRSNPASKVLHRVIMAKAQGDGDDTISRCTTLSIAQPGVSILRKSIADVRGPLLTKTNLNFFPSQQQKESSSHEYGSMIKQQQRSPMLPLARLAQQMHERFEEESGKNTTKLLMAYDNSCGTASTGVTTIRAAAPNSYLAKKHSGSSEGQQCFTQVSSKFKSAVLMNDALPPVGEAFSVRADLMLQRMSAGDTNKGETLKQASHSSKLSRTIAHDQDPPPVASRNAMKQGSNTSNARDQGALFKHVAPISGSSIFSMNNRSVSRLVSAYSPAAPQMPSYFNQQQQQQNSSTERPKGFMTSNRFFQGTSHGKRPTVRDLAV